MGVPSQELILAHALMGYDHFKKRFSKRCHEINPVGRRLGSTVAIYVASRRLTPSLITSFDSMDSLGKWRYPFVPTSLSLRHKFPAREWIEAVHVFILVVLAQHDETVLNVFAKRPDKGNERVHTELVRGTNHESIGESLDLYKIFKKYWSNP